MVEQNKGVHRRLLAKECALCFGVIIMCGIAGMIDYSGNRPNKATTRAMLDSMRRRGPDDEGEYIVDYATLLHARLAVVDIEHGKQPMTCAHRGCEFTVVYNGELYNTEEVRRDLLREGETFTGHSDTEVLLKAYAHWGEDCLYKFNGIYAFGIWDSQKQELFIARDRMGVKPFFFARPKGAFLFASEIKTILKHPYVEPILDEKGIAEILFIGPGRTPGCGVFRDIFELRPGWCGTFTRRGLSIHPYFKLEDHPHSEDMETTTSHVRDLVFDAIERQLVSDVPIGTFLSGGLDSSIISAVANKVLKDRGEKLQTFSVTYRDNEKYFKANRFQPNSDDDYIQTMVDFLGSDHHLFVIQIPELVQALYSSVDARDLPGWADVDSSLLLFCEDIKKHVTVALSGECADEIFGGYPWYRDERIRSAYGFPWAQTTGYRNTFLSQTLKNRIDGFEQVDRRYRETLLEVDKQQDLNPLESRMREMVHLNMYWFMQTLLDRKDRMSMYSGLEVRVPFCDHRIVQYMYSVPWEMKDYQGVEKGLLRHAVKGLLPESILTRKKSPYPKTHDPAYMSAVCHELENILSRDDAPIWQLLNKENVKGLMHTNAQEPWYGQLMTTPQTIAYFLQLNYWMEKYRVRLKL